MICIDFKEAMKYEFYANPTITAYGTLPPFLKDKISGTKPEIYNGFRPIWYPNTEAMRLFLMEEVWGVNFMSRSLKWVIGHNGSPLSEDSIQIDHIMKWESISNHLMSDYSGKNAPGTPWSFRTPLPEPEKLIKGIDYIDNPVVLDQFGEDVLYKFTNIAAIKYFHTIENLRPLPGSINAKRNNENKTDKELGILHPARINFDLMCKLSELSAKCEEYISQVVHEVDDNPDEDYRNTLAEKFAEKTDELIGSIDQNMRGLFI